jgi:thiosulfate/3-mercaptopyruvate sulfurtransferase
MKVLSDSQDKPLVSIAELAELVASGSVLVFDCRFDLVHPQQGRSAWLSAHIPGAVHADLDQHLSGPISAHSGRHPLPAPDTFAAFLAESGYTRERKTVAYDAQGGAFAARLWWLMRYFGLGHCAVLDGGIGAWVAAGYSLEPGVVKPAPQAAPELTPRPVMVLDSQRVASGLENAEIRLLDARSANRFRGEDETLDPVAGHVPGALSHPFQNNLDEHGRFRDAASLRAEFQRALGAYRPEQAVHMCGSGVTACQNVLAMECAGLPGSRLYPESWSGWITDPDRPVARGPN